MSFLTRFFQPEPPAPALTDEAQIQKLYRSLRIRTFLTIYFGYVVFYITRKNLSSALHIFSEQLGIDIIDLRQKRISNEFQLKLLNLIG